MMHSLTAIVYTGLMALSLLGGFWIAKRGAEGFEQKAVRFLAGPILMSLTWLFVYRILWAIYYDHNWDRLQTTFALAQGTSIYHSLNDGVVLNTIYGPVAFLLYLPATMTNDPHLSMRIAEIILMASFFVPALLHFIWKGHEAKIPAQPDIATRLLAFFLFCSFPFIVSALRAAAFDIHVDGAALGFSALACLPLYRFRDSRCPDPWLWFSAFAAVLAVWTKQVTVPLLIALPLYIGVTEGLRRAFYYVFCLGCLGGVVSAVFIAFFGFDELLFNLITIPSRHDLRDGGSLSAFLRSGWKLLREFLIILPAAVFSLGPLIFRFRGNFIAWSRVNRVSLFLIVAAAMIPVSILGNTKVGGSNNTLSYTCYFFLLASTLAFLEKQSSPVAGRGLILLSFIFSFVLMGSVYYRIFATAKYDSYAETALAYIQSHPGKTYFPRLAVFHTMGEGKVYHSSVALRDRLWARKPVRWKHFRRYIPESLETVAFRRGSDNDIRQLWLPGFRIVPGGDENLPGFDVYRRGT